MIDHEMNQLTLRARLLTLVVCTTGLTTLAATKTGYTRSAGSFITDLFAPGMEILPAGFPSNTRRVVSLVEAQTLTITEEISAAGAQASRSLSVPLPGTRAWEGLPVVDAAGVETETRVGVPYVEEEYLHGPSDMRTGAENGVIIGQPMWILHLNAVNRVDISGAARYTKAILALFPPNLSIALANGDHLRVRSDVNPSASQLRTITQSPAWAVRTISIPLEIYTLNA